MREKKSPFIQRVLRKYFEHESRPQIHARDLDRINAAADQAQEEQ